VASGSNPSDPGVMQALIDFFSGLWGGNTSTAAPSASDKLGFAYYYDEDGSLLYELGAGGANSSGSAHYVYLPTPAGPMPIATYTGSKHYAVHTDHLNTPRRLTNSSKQVAWQWAFSAFGEEQPTTAKNRFVDPSTTPNAGSTTVADVTFNLRYPGQYFDKESGLHYNWMRSYDPKVRGGYTQPDPIDLAGGWNKFAYVSGNPLGDVDPNGLMGRGQPDRGGTPGRQPKAGQCENDHRCENTITVKTDGVCEPSDIQCRLAMQAAGIKGPYSYVYKKYDLTCMLKLGIFVKGSSAAAGVAAGRYGPGLAARGLSAAGAPLAGAYAGAIGTTAAEIASGPIGITFSVVGAASYLLNECECNAGE
jgi:RHS repeat-associated protein